MIWEMDWTWSAEDVWHAWKGRRMESKAVRFILSSTSILQSSYRILAFSYRNCVIFSTSRLISMTFLCLIFYYLIVHDELHELSKTQSAIKRRSLFKCPPSYFSLAYTTAVNQACLFQTPLFPLAAVRQVWQVSNSRVSFCKFCGSQCQG